MIINLKEGEYLGKKLKAIENSFFNLSMTTYSPNRIIEKHYHDNNYLSILINGNYIEYSQKDKHSVMIGDILFRPKGYTHENEFQKYGGTCLNIEFHSDWENKLDNNLKLPQNYKHFKSGTFPSLYKLLLNFQYSYNEDFTMEYLCDWLFQINQSTTKKLAQPWIEKVTQILDNELHIFHSLNSLSERVYVHPIYLTRAFKEHKGVTIGEYQLKAKLTNAFYLLLNTSYLIRDIAFLNGFYDDAHFIRSFNTVYKISPQKFRLAIKS